MITAKLAGAVIVAVPAIVLAWALLWRRQRPIFWFAAALILVGAGYLAATGAADEIAQRLIPDLVAPHAAPVKAK